MTKIKDEIRTAAQLNTAINPVLNRVTEHIQDIHDAKSKQGELIAPRYCVGYPEVISICIERINRDLINKTLRADDLMRHASQYKAEPYARGLHAFFPQETSQLIPSLATRMIGSSPEIHKTIYWRKNISYKAIISIAIYYVEDVTE